MSKGWRLAQGVLVLVWTGCASVGVRPQTLRLTITPETIKPGNVVTVRVDAPPGTRDVRGQLDLLGSPVIPLRSRDQGRTWWFVTQIPVSAVWKPGRYRAIVRGLAADGSELQGEAWVNAP